MKITILTMFPELFSSIQESPVIRRAIKQELFQLEILDIKNFAEGCFRHIDDSPYGGSNGMIVRVDVLVKALESVRTEKSHVVLLSPKGKTYNQSKAKEFTKLDHLILVCGHYEGIDARFDSYVDEFVSVGNFILTGGEIPACLITDSVVRLIDGVMKDGVTANESFEDNLLEYPQYTHPYDFRGTKVPDILLSGNHEAITKWKHEKAVEETKKFRPDLLI